MILKQTAKSVIFVEKVRFFRIICAAFLLSVTCCLLGCDIESTTSVPTGNQPTQSVTSLPDSQMPKDTDTTLPSKTDGQGDKTQLPEATDTKVQTQEPTQEPTPTPTPEDTDIPVTPVITPTPTPTPTPIPTLTPTPELPPEDTKPTTNLFNGFMEYGGLDEKGNEYDKDNVLRTGFVEVEPNCVYTLSTLRMGSPFVTGTVIEYDENKNYICHTVSSVRVSPFTFVTRENTRYIRWYTEESIYATIENALWIEYWLEEGRESSPWKVILSQYHRDTPKSKGVYNMLARLSLFCDTMFETKGNGMVIGYTNPSKIGMANPYDAVYMGRGKKFIGMPYSSLRKTDSYVGYEVSFETYFTALYNPASIMYTANYQNPSSSGYSPFIYYVWNPYGAVCSTMIGYSLGIDIRYSTYEWSDIDGMERVDITKDGLELGDVLCNVTSKDKSGGHIAMVTDIVRDDNGNIVYVRITEAGIPTMLESYVFYDYFKNAYLLDYALYRYKYIDAVPEADLGYADGSLVYNEVLGIDRGDKAVYPLGSKVEVNIMDDNVSSLIIESYSEKTGEYVSLYTVRSNSFSIKIIGGGEYTVYSFLPENAGKYRLYCRMNDGSISGYIYFIAADPGEISLELEDGQRADNLKPSQKITVSFGDYKACTPLYICIETDKYVTRSQRMLSMDELKEGRATVSYYTTGKCYIKIYYQNEFGRICSERIAVEFK